MDNKEPTCFQIVDNNFENIDSEFTISTTLNTSANLGRPFYAQISTITDTKDTKIVGIKTAQSIILGVFKNTEFVSHRKIITDDRRLERQQFSYFAFKKPTFSSINPAHIIIGYSSGLIAYVNTLDSRVNNILNYDEKNREPFRYAPVNFITSVPDTNGDEILVLFGDYTIMKFKLSVETNHPQFLEKIKKFEEKTSFSKIHNKVTYKKKTRNQMVYGANLNDNQPEFNYFYAYNEDFPVQNPISYFKFNQRTISDLILKKHKSFSKTLLKKTGNPQDVTVMTMTSLNGYLLIFDYYKMAPLLSFKSYFGGINSFTYSESCELIALSGQNDCITVLDLDTKRWISCEGHRSFVSKTIFQTIPEKPFKQETPSGDDKNRPADGGSPNKSDLNSTLNTSVTSSMTFQQNEDSWDHIRLISGSMDSSMMYWEMKKDIFTSQENSNNNQGGGFSNQIPYRLRQAEENQTIKAVHRENCKDAIGWVEKADKILFQCAYDGIISTYVVKNLDQVIQAPNSQKDTEEQKTNQGNYNDGRNNNGQENDNDDDGQQHNQRYNSSNQRDQESSDQYAQYSNDPKYQGQRQPPGY